jgi:GxxExxY protein
MDENQLSNSIIGAAIEVHRVLGGPGLLEDVYEEAHCHELTLRGFDVKRQVKIPVLYKGVPIKSPLQLDLLVNDLVIVEVKAIEKHNPVHLTQLLTYLRLTGKKLGLLINFGEAKIANGVHRVVNNI